MKLAIIVPVYNEEKNIKKLINDWDKEIKKSYIKKYKFIVLNDGSKDNTNSVIKSLKNNKIIYISHKNIGHGNTCLKGYKLAIKLDFNYIMQIDSDNQCDPIYFKHFLKEIKNNNAVLGNRVSREDGIIRIVFSRILSFLIFLKTFTFVKDANVPYRIIKKDVLKKLVNKISKNIELKNCHLSYLLERNYKIKWISINFRKRYYGETKYGFSKLVRQVLNLLVYI